MSSYDTTAGATSNIAPDGDPDQIRAGIERTRSELGDNVTALADKVDPRTRAKNAFSTVRTKAASATSRVTAAAPGKARQAGQTVRGNPAPTAGAVLVLAGAVAGAVLTRRRAAAARAARSRWSVFSRR